MGLVQVKPLLVALVLSWATTSHAGEMSPQGRVLGIAQTLAEISSSEAPAEVKHARLCQMVKQSMDVRGIATFLLGTFKRETPPASFEAFAQVLPQAVVENFRDLSQIKNLTAEIKRAFETENGIEVQAVFQSQLPYNLSFSLVRTADDLLVRDITIEGISMMLNKRTDLQHELRRLRRGGSTDPVLALATNLGTQSTPCP